MQQLELRFYTREEIAELTGARLEDTKHFKRNAENVLMKWGYGYDWIKGGASITHIPTTPEERLQEILIRQFQVDIQVDMYAFACFITAFTDIPGFDAMPWAVRQDAFQKYSGKYVSSRTLSSWSRKLIEKEIMARDCIGTYWKTEINGLQKVRTLVTEEEAKDYFKRRSELLHTTMEQNMQAGMDCEAAYKAAWKDLYAELWAEFNCCYYFCKAFTFAAWNERGLLFEVYELTREISGKESLYA